MQVARFAAAESCPSATIRLLLRRSVHSLVAGGSLLQSGSAAAAAAAARGGGGGGGIEGVSSSRINGISTGNGGQLREPQGRELLSGGGGGGGGGDWQLCGRGDKRTKKGKRFKGSFGNCRHRKNWETQRLREKWEIPSGPAPGSLLPRPFPPLLTRY